MHGADAPDLLEVPPPTPKPPGRPPAGVDTRGLGTLSLALPGSGTRPPGGSASGRKAVT